MVARRLIVLPDADRVEQWLGDAARTAAFVDARQVCTFSQLVDRCEPARWVGRTPAEPLLSRLLLTSLVPSVAERAFGLAARAPEFAAQVQELIAHLRTQNVTPARLLQAASTASDALAARARALATLWARLDEGLEARGLVERLQLIQVATARLEKEGLPPRLREVGSIELRHVHDLSASRLAFLEALATACHQAHVGFTVQWPSSGLQITDLYVLDAVRTIEARWQQLEAEAFPDVAEAPLSWVVAEAFAEHEVEPRPAPELHAFSAAAPRDEARAIAARVKQCVLAGTPPERIAVAFRDLADEAPMLVEALTQLGVPARARIGVPLLSTPVGRLAFSVFSLLEDGFPSSEVAALLESRYVRIAPENAASPRAAFLEAGVRDDHIGAQGERGAYAVRLEALERRVKSEQGRQAVNSLRESVGIVLRVVRGIADEAPALELLEAWWESLSRLGLFRALTERPERRLGQRRAVEDAVDRAVARDQAAGEALLDLLTTLKRALHSSGVSSRRMTRRDFSRLMYRAAQDVTIFSPGPRAGAVSILDVRELAGRHFDALFVGGLEDGRFPGRPAPLPLLSEEERGTLNRLAKAPLFRLSVGDSGDFLPLRLAEDRLLLHLALSAANEVTLSRARFDAAGRESLASPFFDALARAVSDFRVEPLGRVPAPRFDEVMCEDDLRARVALEVASAVRTRQTARDVRAETMAQLFAEEAWLVEAKEVARIEHERLRFFSQTSVAANAYSGRVQGATLQSLLPRFEFGAQRPVSAAELNVWNQCRFRGLGVYVLGLRGADSAGEEPDARTRGTYWHDVLSQVVPRLDQQGLLGAADAPVKVVRELVDRAVHDGARAIEATASTGHPALWALTQLRTATIMRRLVSAPHAIRPFSQSRVLGVELEFGSPKSSIEALREVKVPAAFSDERDVYLRGRIDRVDHAAGRIDVIDYKTSLSNVAASDLQLWFYLAAVHQWRPDASWDAAWVGMRKREVRTLSQSVIRTGGAAELLAFDAPTREKAATEGKANLANAVHLVLGQLRQGDFGPRPVECAYCELKPVCRISHRRLMGED